VTGLAPTIGREDDLTRLRAAFEAATPPVVRVLTGMGGVGKTSIARAYTDRHRADYNLLWWVRAEDPNAIDAEFRALLDTVLPPGQAAQLTNARTAAFAYLAKQEDLWLLVLDNVPDATAANDLLPILGNGHVLITSQATAWPDPSVVLPVFPLTVESSIELLTIQSQDDDRDAAGSLAAELAGLPLALAQAASFTRTSAMTLTTYLRLYRDRNIELHKEGSPADYPYTVATTWQLAIGRLSESAREMLNVLAFCASDEIPVHLLFRSMDELDRHRVIGELNAYSLATSDGSNGVAVHRLIQTVTRNRLLEDLTAHEWVDKGRAMIMAIMPAESDAVMGLATWNSIRTHVRALLDHLPPEHADTLSLRRHLASWTGKAGDAEGARDRFAELLAIQKRVLGSEHPDTLTAAHNLAYWLGLTDPRAALMMLTNLLAVRSRVLGPDHPGTLDTRHLHAACTGRAGNAARARDLFAELLTVRERVLGVEHADTLSTRHCLAGWTGYAGDWKRAQVLFAELLAVRERVLGQDHPDTLIDRQHLANLIGDAGNPARARDLFAEILPAKQRAFGPEHPETLGVCRTLANWTGAAGEFEKARDLLAELLPVQERVLGEEHPDTLTTEDDLAYWSDLASLMEEEGPGESGEG
jgi:hypothetical protein